MTRILIAVMTIVFVAFTLSACSSSSEQAQLPPHSVELKLAQYPILPGDVRMDTAILKSLGLRAEKLEKSLMVFVYYRYGVDQKTDWESHWHHRMLKPGTVVAVDKAGRPWYLVSDARRIYAAESGSAMSAAAKTPAKAPAPPKKSSSDKDNGGFPWWLILFTLGVAAIVGYLIWRSRRDQAELDRALGPDDPDDPSPADLFAGRDPGPHTLRPDGFMESINRRFATTGSKIDGLAAAVADLQGSVAGMEDRVVTRLEPVVRQAAEGGGKARAQALLAEQIAQKAAEGDAAMVASLTRVLESVS